MALQFRTMYHLVHGTRAFFCSRYLKVSRRSVIDRMMKRRVGHTLLLSPLQGSSPGAFRRLSRKYRARPILRATSLRDLLFIDVSVYIFVCSRAGLLNRKVCNCMGTPQLSRASGLDIFSCSFRVI
ncbi:hypothetical protein AVEN_223014-1 [Araneus ventricosus]|uniref:Uncharacterized protein n=1 Tax=Araneus ventricosus TaxID=182803 RepID=A0A4Y2UFT2_ARAVE|nr:hypothetical protein AVEN_223014-1 [Araneus ventricosus]